MKTYHLTADSSCLKVYFKKKKSSFVTGVSIKIIALKENNYVDWYTRIIVGHVNLFGSAFGAYYTYKESPYPPGNGFSRALENRFLVPKNEAQCSYFRPMSSFS